MDFGEMLLWLFCGVPAILVGFMFVFMFIVLVLGFFLEWMKK